MKRIKKKLLPLALALAMCLGMFHGNALTAQAAGAVTWLVAPGVYRWYGGGFSDGLMWVKDPNTDKFGYINTAGQLAIPCLYQNAEGFQDGVAKVQMDTFTYAFIGTAGQTLFSWSSRQEIRPVEDAAFSEGMIRAWFRETYDYNATYGFLNMAGQLVVPCQYGEVRDFQGGMAAVRDTNGKKWGFVNAAGQLAVACRYDQVLDFSDGWAAVHDEENNYWGYVDAGGNVALPFQYKQASSFKGGYAQVQLADGSNQWMLIDKAGRNMIPEGYRGIGPTGGRYDHGENFSNDFESNGGFVWIENEGKERRPYLLDKAGGVTGPVGRYTIEQVHDGVVVYNSRQGVITVFDTTGRTLFGGDILEADIYEGYGVPSGEVGCFVDREGNKINLPEGIKAGSPRFSEGFCRVSSKATGTERWGVANTVGQVVISCTYAGVGKFSGGVAPVKNFAGKWGLVDATGAEVLPLQYDEVKQVEGATGIFVVKEGGKYGLVAAPAVYAANGAVVNYAAQAEVNDALNAGIATEALGGDYRNEITRAQLASEAVKLYEAASGQAAPAAGASPFSDVNDPAVTQAQTLGLIDGLSNGTFVPDATVPKEQAAAILSNVSAKVKPEAPAVQAAKFEPEGSKRKTASIEETLATATRILKKIKK